MKTQDFIVRIQTVVKHILTEGGMGKYMIKIQRDRKDSKLRTYNTQKDMERKTGRTRNWLTA